MCATLIKKHKIRDKVRTLMNGKRVLITGATNGIGKVAALELAKMGAEVVIVGRNPQKTERVVNELKITSGNRNIDMLIADLSSMEQIRNLADDFHARYDSLDVLLNNAGAVFDEYKETVDGLEMTFALNHISYFLLTNLLLDTIKRTAQEKGEARIINVSSDAHQSARNGLDFDHLNAKSGFSAFGTYGKSKLANILFTYELARRLDDTNITVNALHPGFVETGFGHNTGSIMKFFTSIAQRLFAKSPEQGAETLVYLASSADVANMTGKYWVDKQTRKSTDISYNRDQQRQLWELSEDITGIAQPTVAA